MLSWKIKLPYWLLSLWFKNQIGLGDKQQASPDAASLEANPAWHRVAFLSDVHLHVQDPDTFRAWEAAVLRCQADALFILGDLFEAWVGDDQTSLSAFDRQCLDVLHQASAVRPIFVMVGNRDFLLGNSFFQSTGCQVLPDPCVLHFLQQRYLLSHGDAWCLADTGYQCLRTLIRSPQLQRRFLQLPLSERIQIGKVLRRDHPHKRHKPINYVDLDWETMRVQLQNHGAHTLIHGHTHRPREQNLGKDQNQHPLQRVVLSDWEAKANPPRTEMLYLSAQGFAREAHLPQPQPQPLSPPATNTLE